MRSITLKTYLDDSIFNLSKLKRFIGKRVIITVIEEEEVEISQKDQLKASFAEITRLNLFSDIEDPLTWQKKQRDEWE